MPSNDFLKKSDTITILPAPLNTKRDTPIRWFEVEGISADKTGRIVACDENGNIIGSTEIRLLGDKTVEITVEESGKVVFSCETTIKSDANGFSAQTKIGSAELNLTGRFDDPSSLQQSNNAITPSQKLPSHWSSLNTDLITLAEALKVRAADGKSWGCGACIYLGGGTVLATVACADAPGFVTCGGASTAWGVFFANCEGACA